MIEQQLVDCEGATLEVFLSSGPGPVICTTHPFVPPQGNSVTSLRTSPYLQALTAAGSLVVVNPRGMGNSSPVVQPTDLTAHRLVADLEAIRQHLGGRPWVFAGGSSGALVGLWYALAHPAALQGLLLFNMAPSGRSVLEDPRSLASPKHPQWRAVPHAAPEPPVPSMAGSDDQQWVRRREDLWVYQEAGIPCVMLPFTGVPTTRHRAALEEFAAFDVVDRLPEIALPTLVVCGRHDPLIPLGQCARLARIPRAEVVVFEESGHDVAADEPGKFGATVRRFVTEHLERRP